MADDSIISYSDLIGDDGTFDKILKDIKKIEKELIASAKRIKKEFAITNPNDVQRIQQLEKEVNELTQANKNLAKATATVNKAKKKSAELTKEQLIQQEALKLERREATRIAKQQAIILKEEGNTIKSLRAQLSLVTIQWSKLTANELKNTKEGKKLVKTKKELTAQLKKLEKQTGDNRRNVGNYTSALSGLDAAFVGLGGNIGITVGAFKSLGLAIGGTARKFGVLKTAIAASGIGALVLAFGSLATFLKRTTEGADKLSQLFAGIGATINVLLDRIAALGSAIVKVFQGDFAGAAEIAKKAVTGAFTEIQKKATAASKEAKALNQIYEEETKLIVENGEKRLKIAELERKAEENKKKDRKAAAAQLRQAIKLTNDIFNSELEIDKKRLAIAKAEVKRSNSLKEDRRKIAEATDAINNKEAQRENIIRGLTRKLNSLTQSEDANQKALQKRLKAIESLNKELRRLQTENIEEGLQKSLELEELRFEEEQKLRTKQFEELKDFFSDNAAKLAELRTLEQNLEAEQLKQHEQNKLDIINDFEQQRIDSVTETVKTAQELVAKQQKADEELLKGSIKGIDEINAKEQELADKRKQRIEEQKANTKETLKQIGETAEKIGQEIVNLLEKQADVAEENVNNQVDNLDRARERAAQGLEANLAFEEAELSKRRAEQQQAEKRAQQAAKLLALFNLVSAYAQNGDENALFRGLADFAILEAFSAGLQGFYEGTEDTGTVLAPLDNKGGRLAILHDNERVMTKAQNMLLNGMSNDMVVQNALLGEQVGDYFNPQSITNQNLFDKQREDFVKSMQGGANQENNSTEMVRELKQIKRQLANQPNFSLEIEKLYEGVYGMVKTEMRNHFKKISRYKLKGRI